jgi:hypothetical protein
MQSKSGGHAKNGTIDSYIEEQRSESSGISQSEIADMVIDES